MMSNERRLGRGLGALLSEPAVDARPTELNLASIRPNPLQPRRHFDTEALAELRDSIRQHGLLQPIVVRRKGDGYEIVAGERRWRACRLAGLQQIPAVVREDLDDRGMLELALVENVQRQDLDPIERARAFQQLQSVLGVTQEQVADRVGLRRPTVTNLLRLLELPESVQALVSSNQLSMGHARAILAAEDPATRLELAKEAVAQHWSVRELERRARAGLQARSAGPAGAATPVGAAEAPAWVADVEARLKTALGTRVAIRAGAGERGHIQIDYYGRRDLDRLLAMLAPRETI
jgi:ParB family transcriptional regulator, chromosome partitioning protein